jgi:NADH-quinone oxidoreductase subunit J
VYIGAVMVLMLFGVMLTRAKLGKDIELNNKNMAVAAPVALLLLGVMVYVLAKGFSDTRLPTDTQPVSNQSISDLIFKPYLLPFWALSFVLLAAVIGAIVLARKD